MGTAEQGRLKLSGIPSGAPPFYLEISQRYGRHGRMKVGVWVSKAEARQIQTGMPVILELGTKGASLPLFCGIITKRLLGKEKGQVCAYIEVDTASSLLDRKKMVCSFQRQSRSYEELIKEIASPYQAQVIWGSRTRGETSCGFLMQYEETDWEFIRRAASQLGYGVLPECRFPGIGLYIGLPDGLEERELKAEDYRIRRQMQGSVSADGTLCTGDEYIVSRIYETLYPGDRVGFRGQRLVVAEKESCLEGGMIKNTYLLREESGFQVERIKNHGLIGASVPGTVLESSPVMSRLRLSTDREGEAADSWHSRPVFYTGGGNGYSGRPEDGDTLYLYFPTEQEEERSVIGGAGAGQMALQAVTQQIMDDTASDEEAVQKEQMQQIGVGADDSGGTVHEALSISQGAGGSLPKADAANMTSYKNWTTPGEQGISLNPAGIRTYNRTGSSFRMGSSGISMTGSGDAALKGKNGLEISMLRGKQIWLSAKGYIYIQCGMSAVALLPEEIHIKGTEVILDSPLNEATEALPDKESIEALKEIYHEAKWGSPLQLFMPDGTAIGRVYGLEEDEALRRYFDENIIGTEGYARYLCTPELQQLYDDGVLDDAGEEVYNDNLYWKWLTETYGKTDWQRFEDWLMTKEGRHTALDAVGFVFDAADLVNGALYLMERDWGGAALSLVCAIPLVGSLVVGGVKGGRYLLKRGKTLIDASGLAKLEKDAKVMKELDSIKLFFYARKADWEDISRYIKRLGEQLGDLAGDGRYAELVTPDGYRIPVSKDLKIDIKMMDEMGDTLEDALQVGKKWSGILGEGEDVLKLSDWDDVKKTYRGMIGKLKSDKPRYSPDIKKWLNGGGSIEIENINGKKIWTYVSASGDSVPYIDGYVKFPDKYLHPTIKSVDIGEFTGDRSKDIDKMMKVLENDYGITEIPDGYIVHHDIEKGILQLVDENIHKEFTHIGGHSIYQ